MPESRVALFSELPTPYRWPVFQRLLERAEFDLRIFFCARSEPDRDWDFDFRPDRRVRFLPVRTFSSTGRRTIHYHVNPTVFGELRRGRFDVVVFPGYAMFASHAGEGWCRAHGTPYVIFSETTRLDARSGAVRALKRAVVGPLVAGASAWLATGRLSREYLISYGAGDAAIFPFPNTPDVAGFQRGAAAARRDRMAVRAHYGATERPVVLFVGRLIGVKRVDLLIEAAGRLRGAAAEPAVWIAGDGADRGELMALARERGLSEVRFLGSVPTADLAGLYAAADLFVLPSDHEPWGAVTLEAAACGLPIVVSDRVGAGPDVVDTENGGVFPAGDAGALAALLGSLLADPAGLRRMGGLSSERMRTLGPDRCVESFGKAIDFARTRGA